MKHWKNIFSNDILILLIIVSFAFGLRINKYWEFPVGGETQDESAWAFLGASLLQAGQPTSWSHFSPYQPNYIYQKQENFTLVRPVLDHPPLFSFLPGLAHTLKNDWQVFPSIKLTRLPMIFLGAINVLLLTLVVRRFFSNKLTWIMAGMIYAVGPSFVFSSRLVVAENLLVTWSLLALLILSISKLKHKSWFLVLIGVAAVLTKISGLVIPSSIFLYGLANKDKKIALAGGLGATLGTVLFAAYGAYFNWSLFVEILSSQAGRDLGLATLHNRLFLHPAIVEKFFFDGWLFLGLFGSILFFIKKNDRLSAITIFLLVNLFFIALTSGEQTFHGWYDYVLQPFFVIAIAALGEEIFLKKSWLLFAFSWLLILPIFRLVALGGEFYHLLPSWAIRLVTLIGFVPYGLTMFGLIAEKKVSQFAHLLLLFVMIASIFATLTFGQTIYWEGHQFFSQW